MKDSKDSKIFLNTKVDDLNINLKKFLSLDYLIHYNDETNNEKDVQSIVKGEKDILINTSTLISSSLFSSFLRLSLLFFHQTQQTNIFYTPFLTLFLYFSQ